MFSLYTVLLTLHILLVICWLGAGIATTVISRQCKGDPSWAPLLVPLARKWFPITSGLTGVVGILLVIERPYGFGEPWIAIAIAGWLISSFVGATQLGPRVEKWAETGDREAFDSYMRLALIDIALLTLIVADMVMKPGF